MKRAIIALGLLTAISSQALAAGVMSKDAALDKAVAILKGDPYGKNRSEVLSAIKSQILIVKGPVACIHADAKSPIWTFHVEVKEIKGDLALDATTGKMVCGGLPYLD